MGFACKALYDLVSICLSTVLPHLPYPTLRTVAVATLSKALFPGCVLLVSDPLTLCPEPPYTFFTSLTPLHNSAVPLLLGNIPQPPKQNWSQPSLSSHQPGY